MAALIFGLLGLIIGSFLNVLIVRYGKGELGGRSGCPSCGRQIASYDLVPVLSFMMLRGRCRSCREKISFQYPLVELTTAVLFALIGATHLPLIQALVALATLSMLIAIFTYDLQHMIIPDPWTYSFIALAVLFSGLRLGDSLLFPEILPWFLLSGPIAASLIFFLWLVTKGAGMGFGDVKLALGIGYLLGPLYGFAAVVFSFIVGAFVSVPLLLLSSLMEKQALARPVPDRLLHNRVHVKTKEGFTIESDASYRRRPRRWTMKSEVPFGPFLIISCVLTWLLILNGYQPLEALGLLPQ